MPNAQSYLALLRGINVGGKHLVPMKELTAICAGAKCSDIHTYIQSGNVIFRASGEAAKTLPALLTKRIEERFGFPVPVILRNADELAQVLRENPFLKADFQEQTLHVYFLRDLPTAAAVKMLDENRSAPDRFHVRDRHIYLHLPNGMGRSKLTNTYFDSKLSTVCTARNWATVQKLYEMMRG